MPDHGPDVETHCAHDADTHEEGRTRAHCLHADTPTRHDESRRPPHGATARTHEISVWSPAQSAARKTRIKTAASNRIATTPSASVHSKTSEASIHVPRAQAPPAWESGGSQTGASRVHPMCCAATRTAARRHAAAGAHSAANLHTRPPIAIEASVRTRDVRQSTCPRQKAHQKNACLQSGHDAKLDFFFVSRLLRPARGVHSVPLARQPVNPGARSNGVPR